MFSTRSFDARDWIEAEIRATTVILALELYWYAHGRYPPLLADLEPEILAEVPVDPVHGGPFAYWPITVDRTGLNYQLYSTGIDADDNDGRRFEPVDHGDPIPAETRVLFDPTIKGYDFVFNVPRPKRRKPVNQAAGPMTPRHSPNPIRAAPPRSQ
jgi:hypothetical protein